MKSEGKKSTPGQTAGETAGVAESSAGESRSDAKAENTAGENEKKAGQGESVPGGAVERQRGEGPTCPLCGSGMTSNGASLTNKVVFWKCLNKEKCGYTKKAARGGQS